MPESTTEIVTMMTDSELLRLADAVGVPMPGRRVTREWLEDAVLEAVLEHGMGIEETPQTPLTDPAIEVEGMSKRFGSRVAVRALDLRVRPGEIVTLVGPNGAGKTTTMRVITGIVRQDGGRVVVNGHDVLREPELAKRVVGYIPERPACYPSLRVHEYLTFVARLYGTPRVRALLRMSWCARVFQLEEYMDAFMGTLSKGNLQRVLVASILVRDPPFVLLLDEPIYGLDPRGAWAFKNELRRLRDGGSAVLLSTHILEAAEGISDRLVVMNEGEVVGRGTMDELRSVHPGATTLEEVFLELTGGVPRP